MKSVVRIAALAATIALLLGPALRVSAADPFDVYVIAPLTGSNALQTSVNATGGIRGRALNFVDLDTQSSPQMAVGLTNQILPKHPSLIVGDMRGMPVDAARMPEWDGAKETWTLASGPGGAKL